MNRVLGVTTVLGLLACVGMLRADDTVVLNDGTTIKGQVLEESSDKVTMNDHGLTRTFDRSMVSRVDFNTDASTSAPASAPSSDASAGNTVPSASGDMNAAPPSGMGDTGGGSVPSLPDQQQQNYALSVSDYYSVPPEQVWGLESRGISYEELPVVYYLARRAMVEPSVVVEFRSEGMPWYRVAMRLGLGPDVFYWDDVFQADLGGPYSDLYVRYHRHWRHWYWDDLALTDMDIINLVNLRFNADYYHRPLVEVANDRIYGRPFFYIGFNFGNTYGYPWRAHYGAGYGAGFNGYYHAHYVGAAAHGGWGGGYGHDGYGHVNYNAGGNAWHGGAWAGGGAVQGHGLTPGGGGNHVPMGSSGGSSFHGGGNGAAPMGSPSGSHGSNPGFSSHNSSSHNFSGHGGHNSSGHGHGQGMGSKNKGNGSSGNGNGKGNDQKKNNF
jgi:hypothetical protein